VGSIEVRLISNVRNYAHLFFVAQQPKLGVGFLIVEVYRLHTIRYTHTNTNTNTHTHTNTYTVRLFSTSDQLVAEATTYTTHKKHKRRTSMLSVGFEPAILATERPQTHALDHTDGHRYRHTNTVTHL
jgi:hypothetical protein